MRAREAYRLSRALFIAGFFGVFLGQSMSESVSRMYGALRAWFVIARDRRKPVAPRIYTARLECCAACPFFSARFGTCGSPLKRGMREYGCWCYMPVAARYAGKQCWIDERVFCGDDRISAFAGHGWKANGCCRCPPPAPDGQAQEPAAHPRTIAGRR